MDWQTAWARMKGYVTYKIGGQPRPSTGVSVQQTRQTGKANLSTSLSEDWLGMTLANDIGIAINLSRCSRDALGMLSLTD